MSSAMDDYDEGTQKCKVCKHMVLIKTGKTGAKYMVNGDDSYHKVFAKGNSVCCTTKEQVEYAKEHGTLEGMGSVSNTTPTTETPPKPTGPDKSLVKLETYMIQYCDWWKKMWPQAVLIAQNTCKCTANSLDLRICACGIMHDMVTLHLSKATVDSGNH